MIPTELHTTEIPKVYEAFARLVGEDLWTRRSVVLREEVRGNPFLDDYISEENSIVFSLDRCAKLKSMFGRIPDHETLNRGIYTAMGFAAQATAIIQSAPAALQRSLLRRVQGSVQNPEDLRALQLEFQAATHLINRGHRIIWPEVEEKGRIDILAPALGPQGLEVECKALSTDKGRKVHRRDALEFGHLLSQQVDRIVGGLRVGVSAVLTLPDRLPTSRKARRQLAERVRQQLVIGRSGVLPCGANVRIREFDATGLLSFDSNGNLQVNRSVLDRVTLTQNREAMVMGRTPQGPLIFVLQSAKDDTVLRSLFKTLKRAADEQLSKHVPGFLWVGMNGVDSNELLNLATNDTSLSPTGLRIGTSRFLSNPSRGHVVGVGYFSRNALMDLGGGAVVQGGGGVYHFPNRQSPMWCEDLEGLFVARA